MEGVQGFADVSSSDEAVGNLEEVAGIADVSSDEQEVAQRDGEDAPLRRRGLPQANSYKFPFVG